jgi:hypothetical protein
MGLLQDKKVAVALALIVIVVGSIAYLIMDIPKSENSKINNMTLTKTSYAAESTRVNNIPMVENEAII